MKIRLRLFATLQQYLPPGSSDSETVIELPAAATIPDALAVLGVPMELPHIVFVNGRHVLRPDLAAFNLKDGDILAAFPAIGGG
jgi:sulfur carrier protein ThiS